MKKRDDTYRLSVITKHGMYGTSFYQRWRAIQTRCANKNHVAFHRYGGRGILCLWDSFDAFKQDMYESYLEHTKTHGEKKTQLDRINNDSHYSKDNCRWVTPKENANNSISAKLITFRGVTLCTRDWSHSLGFSKNCVAERLYRGWSIEKALTTPLKKGR